MKNEQDKVLTIYVPEKEAVEFKAKCAIEGKSMTEVIREFIFAYVEKKLA